MFLGVLGSFRVLLPSLASGQKSRSDGYYLNTIFTRAASRAALLPGNLASALAQEIKVPSARIAEEKGSTLFQGFVKISHAAHAKKAISFFVDDLDAVYGQFG
jgi:hypothetical protein